jgi:hypothetical protein
MLYYAEQLVVGAKNAKYLKATGVLYPHTHTQSPQSRSIIACENLVSDTLLLPGFREHRRGAGE